MLRKAWFQPALSQSGRKREWLVLRVAWGHVTLQRNIIIEYIVGFTTVRPETTHTLTTCVHNEGRSIVANVSTVWHDWKARAHKRILSRDQLNRSWPRFLQTYRGPVAGRPVSGFTKILWRSEFPNLDIICFTLCKTQSRLTCFNFRFSWMWVWF